MELKDQVVSMVLAKHLSELGIKADSLYYWAWNDFNKLVLQSSPMLITGSAPDFEQHEAREYYLAYTVAELGKFLLNSDYIFNFFRDTDGMYVFGIKGIIDFSSENEADSRAKMIIYLKEKNLI